MESNFATTEAIYRMRPADHITCPSCQQPHIRRSHRRWYDAILQRFSIYAFRCKTCDHRFHRMITPELRQRIIHQ